MNRNPFDGAVIYGAPSAPPTTTPDFSDLFDMLAKGGNPMGQPVAPMGKAAVKAQIERLVKLRLSPAVTDDAVRAELDAIIGALYVAAAMP